MVTTPAALAPAPAISVDQALGAKLSTATSDASGVETIGLLPFYVYELRDPRNNEVFYVGKGTGLRLDAHVAGDESEKGMRIAEIERSGGAVQRIVIGRFETETEAFAVESTLIKWVYGFRNLTNRVRGHRERFIRGHEQVAAAEFTPLPGIDVERRIRNVQDGSFTAEQRRKISEHGIVEKLETLRSALQQVPELRDLTFSDVDLSRADNPRIVLTGFSEAIRMDIVMQLTGDRIKLGLVPIDPSHLAAYDRALTSIDEPFTIKNGQSASRYTHTDDFVSKAGGLRGGIPHEDTDLIAAQMVRAIRRLLAARL